METYTVGFASNNSTQMSPNNNNNYELDQTNKINND